MGLSNKMLLGLAGSAATLALVGVGAGASFTDTGSAGTAISTGNVKMYVGISRSTDWGPTYSSDGTSGVLSPLNLTDVTPASPNDGALSSFTLSSLTNMGSAFKETFNIVTQNTGSLPIQHLSMVVTDPANGASQLAQDTNVEIQPIVGSNTGVAPVLGADLYNGTLSNLESSTGTSALQLLSAALPTGSFPGNFKAFEVTITPSGGTYSNADENGSVAPTFTLTGSDI